MRVSEDAEIMGVDDAEIGEFAYDYVELTREVVNGEEAELEGVEGREWRHERESVRMDEKARHSPSTRERDSDLEMGIDSA